MVSAAPSRPDVAAARDDLGRFAELVGWPLEEWQLAALRLETRQTCLLSPRQCGKSRSLAVLATWWAYRKPGQVVLVVSASEGAAGRLLRAIQQVSLNPLLSGSVVDETQHRLILSNASEIRSVPASERQVRGYSVDLLLVDEASFVSEDLLVSAAMPTTAARPDARVVLASTPWGDSGPFHSLVLAGEDGRSPHTRTFRWKLADAWWIAPSVIEAAKLTMSPLRFRAEFEGEFVGAADAYFRMEDVLACVADFPVRFHGDRGPAACGLDWGRQQDAHAIALAGLLDDYGVNGRPVVVVPYAETSRRPYGQQVARVGELAGGWALDGVFSETNGVGAAPTEDLRQRYPQLRVVPVSTTLPSKENAYGRVQVLLQERRAVLPNLPELLRQLGGVSADPTPSGGLRIAARVESLHDDLPDAVSLAVAGLPRELGTVPLRDVPDGQQWTETPGGVRVPVPVQTTEPGGSWYAAYQRVLCRGCGQVYSESEDACPGCEAANTARRPPAGSAPGGAAGGAAAGDVPVPNSYAPDLMECAKGHQYLGSHYERCPRCHGASPVRPAGASSGTRPGRR